MPQQFRAYVGPADVASDAIFQSEAFAKNYVRQALVTAAEESPTDAETIDTILIELETAEGEYRTFFSVGGETWLARYSQ